MSALHATRKLIQKTARMKAGFVKPPQLSAQEPIDRARRIALALNHKSVRKQNQLSETLSELNQLKEIEKNRPLTEKEKNAGDEKQAFLRKNLVRLRAAQLTWEDFSYLLKPLKSIPVKKVERKKNSKQHQPEKSANHLKPESQLEELANYFETVIKKNPNKLAEFRRIVNEYRGKGFKAEEAQRAAIQFIQKMPRH